MDRCGDQSCDDDEMTSQLEGVFILLPPIFDYIVGAVQAGTFHHEIKRGSLF